MSKPRLQKVWLCGDDKCKAELETIPTRHCYLCPKCGKEWDAMRTHELNYREEWDEYLAALALPTPQEDGE